MKLLCLNLLLLSINYVYSQEPSASYWRVIRESDGDAFWSKPSTVFVPDVEKKYTVSDLSNTNASSKLVSLGYAPNDKFSDPSKYRVVSEDFSRIEIFSFSPEEDYTYNQYRKPSNDARFPRNSGKSIYNLATEEDFLRYQKNLMAVAAEIKEMKNLRYAKVVYPNEFVIKELLKCKSLEMLVLINPVGQLSDSLSLISIKTLYIIGNRKNGYDYYPLQCAPVQFSKQSFEKLEKLVVEENSINLHPYPLNTMPLRQVELTIEDTHLNEFNDNPLPLNANLKLTVVSEIGENYCVLGVDHLSPLNSLQIISYQPLRFDNSLKRLANIKSLSIRELIVSKDKNKSIIDTVDFPPNLECLVLFTPIGKQSNLHKLKSLKTLTLSVDSVFQYDRKMKGTGSLETLFLLSQTSLNIRTKSIPKQIYVFGSRCYDTDTSLFKAIERSRVLNEIHMSDAIFINCFLNVDHMKGQKKIFIYDVSGSKYPPDAEIITLKKRISPSELLIHQPSSTLNFVPSCL